MPAETASRTDVSCLCTYNTLMFNTTLWCTFCFFNLEIKIAPTKTYHKKTGKNLKVKGSQRPQEILQTSSLRIPYGDTLPPHTYSVLHHNHQWVMADSKCSIYKGGVPLNLQMTIYHTTHSFGSGRLPLNFQPPHYRQFSRTSSVASFYSSTKWKCHPLTAYIIVLHFVTWVLKQPLWFLLNEVEGYFSHYRNYKALFSCQYRNYVYVFIFERLFSK